MAITVDKSLVPYLKKWPSFKKSYLHTPKEITRVAEKVAKLYSFFLRREAHVGKFAEDLRKEKNLGSYTLRPFKFASPEKIAKFEEILKEKIETKLSKKEWFYFDAEGFGRENILHMSMREAEIEKSSYIWHYPRGTCTYLNVYESSKFHISLEVNLTRSF